MGVYIRGMEMPEDKAVLIIKHDDDGKVYIKHWGILEYSMELIEVKEPHGDLIDRDELIEDIANQVPYIIDDSDAQSYTNGLGAAKVSADIAPVVIKAEGDK